VGSGHDGRAGVKQKTAGRTGAHLYLDGSLSWVAKNGHGAVCGSEREREEGREEGRGGEEGTRYRMLCWLLVLELSMAVCGKRGCGLSERGKPKLDGRGQNI
jgi:hypothetical protein